MHNISFILHESICDRKIHNEIVTSTVICFMKILTKLPYVSSRYEDKGTLGYFLLIRRQHVLCYNKKECIIDWKCITDGSFHPSALYIYCIMAKEIDKFFKKETSLLDTYVLPSALEKYLSSSFNPSRYL